MRVLAMVLCTVAITGCGSGGKAAPKAAATPTATPAATGPGTLERYAINGISTVLPGNWTGKRDGDGIVVGPVKGRRGAVGFFVHEDGHTAKQWFEQIVQHGNPAKVLSRRTVTIATLGKGLQVRTKREHSAPQDALYLATIDGLLVDLTIDQGDLSDGQVRTILSSVRRDG